MDEGGRGEEEEGLVVSRLSCSDLKDQVTVGPVNDINDSRDTTVDWRDGKMDGLTYRYKLKGKLSKLDQ